MIDGAEAMHGASIGVVKIAGLDDQ